MNNDLVGEKAKRIIQDLKNEGFDEKQIKDAFNDGEWLTKEGYTNNDQILIEEIDSLL